MLTDTITTRRRNVRGYSLGLASQGWHLVTAFALYAFLARTFGPQRFGDWRLVLSILSWFEIIVASGVTKSLVKAISRDPQDTGTFGRAAYLSQITVATGVCAFMVLTAGRVAESLHAPELAPLLRIAAADIPLFALMMAASAYLLGTGRFERQAVGWMAYASSKAVLIALLASGMSVTGAFLGNAASSLVGLSAMAVPLARRQPGRVGGLAPVARGLITAALPFVALAVVDGLNMNSDLWALSALSGKGPHVGLYASAAILAEVPVFLFIGLNRVVFPKVSQAHANGDYAERDAHTVLGIRVALVVCAMGVAVAIFGGGPLLTFVFSAEYAAAAVPLAWLMVAALGRTLLSLASEVLAARDRMRRALTVLLLTGLAQVVAVVALVPRFGLSGAAAGAAAASLGGALAALFGIRDSLGRRPLGTLMRSLVSALLAATPLAFVSGLSALVLLTLVASSIAYAVLLVVTREVGPSDLAALGLLLPARKARSKGR